MLNGAYCWAAMLWTVDWYCVLELRPLRRIGGRPSSWFLRPSASVRSAVIFAVRESCWSFWPWAIVALATAAATRAVSSAFESATSP